MLQVSRCISLLISLLWVSPRLQAQSDVMLTQYWAVPAYYNPAAAGDTDNLRIRGGMRAQWTDIDNAPRTFVAGADAPFRMFDKRWGAGIAVQRQSCGPLRNLTAGLQLGYKHKALGGELTVALQAGLLNEQFKGSEVSVPDDGEQRSEYESMPDYDVDGNALDLGVGIHYSHPRFKAGISLMHANSPAVTFGGVDGVDGAADASADAGDAAEKNCQIKVPRTLYFSAEGNIRVKNTLFEIIPSVLIRSDFTFTDAAATARVRYNGKFSAGIGYRYRDALSVMLGAEFRGIFIGYSYDHHLRGIAKTSSGSHEIFAGYNLKLDFSEKNRYRHKSIRIM